MRDSNFNLTAAIGPTRRVLELPLFSYVNSWGGVSQMLARYSVGNINPFTFNRPIIQPNNTFLAAVSWAEAPYVYRYKLTENIEELLFFPLYINQQIGKAAYIEIWNVNNQPLASITSPWQLIVSKLIPPDLCNCLEITETVQITKITSVTLPPNQYCNPFCVPLCT